MIGATVAASYVRALLEMAVSKGAARDALLRRAGIAAEDLQRQDNRIPLPKYGALMRAGKELCHDPALALHFGESVDLAEVSLLPNVGPVIQTMEQAIGQLNRFAPLDLDIGPRERFQLERIDGQLWLVDRRFGANEYPEITESFLARMVTSLRRWRADAQLVHQVEVTYSAPAYRTEYERIFRAPVRFDSDKTAILFAAEFWNAAPPAVTSRYASAVMSAHADSLLENLENAKTTRGRVERLLAESLHNGDPSIMTVARHLGVSRSTLFRQLKSEGTTFEKVLDELRHRMAVDFLSRPNMSVNDTAYQLGFSDPGAFYRAYKRWTGNSLRGRGRKTGRR